MPHKPLRTGQDGVALLATLLAMLLLSALVAAMVLWTQTESLIASGFRASREAFYTAETAAEWSLGELTTMTDQWPEVVGGLRGSSFTDGPPVGTRMVAGETTVNLTAVGTDNPGWRFFAYGPASSLIPSPGPAQFYIVCLVAPDPAGVERLRLRALAFGPRGTRRAMEWGLLRSARGAHVVSWAEAP